MAGASKEAYAAKRATKLKAAEAAKPEHERLLNKEWNDHVVTAVSVGLLRDIELVKFQVIDIFCLDEVQVCRTTAEAENYFSPNGEPWTIQVLKRFIEAYVLSSNGRLQQELSIWTLSTKVVTLFSAAKYYGNLVEKNVKCNILLWLHTDLKRRGLIHDNRKLKITPLPTDISTLLRSFFQTEYLVASLKTTRAALNVALSLGLMLDCNNRISELIDPEAVPVKLRPAYKNENKEKIFTWRRVELFAFRDGNEYDHTQRVRVQIQARLTFKKLKSPNSIKNGGLMKVIPLRLLPLELAAEDTLRWLIILGLIDGVFKDIRSWADLDRIPYSPDGIEIKVKEGFLDVPVLRSWPYHFSRQGADRLVPMTANHFRRELAMLSRYCGLQYKMLPGCLRRTGAYILSLHASPEERCARMGHSYLDKAYYEYYRNTTSTIDIQSMRHGISGENVTQMSSVTLNRLQSPSTSTLQEPPQGHTNQVSDELASQVEKLISETEKHDEQVQEGMRNIDPAQLAEYSDENIAVNHLLDDLGEISPSDFNDLDLDGTVMDEGKPDTGHINAEMDDRWSKSKNRFALRPVGRYSLFNGITDLLYNQGPDLTDATLSAVFVDMFNHNHLADRFYPNQEPLPGTIDCRFCGEVLTPSAASSKHAFFCENNALHRYVFEKLQRDQAMKPPVKTCTQERCDKPGMHCSYNYLPIDKSAKAQPATRFTSHSKNNHFDQKTSKYVCKFHSSTFSEPSDYRIHMIQEHSAPLSTILALNGKDVIMGSLTFWCKICQVYIPRTESTEDDHFAPHLLELDTVMQPYGLAGLEFSHQWLYPAFCPFCLFDKNLPLPVRMHSYILKSKFMTHVETHLIAKKNNVLYACPAAFDSGDGIHSICDQTTPMSIKQLRDHLVQDHSMLFSQKKSERAKRGERRDNSDDSELEVEEESTRPKKKPMRTI